LRSEYIWFLTILFVVSSFAGCLGDDDDDDKDEDKDIVYDFADNSFVVSAKWLNDNLENESILIIDARGAAAYTAGHIPGAISAIWQEFANVTIPAGEEGFGVLLDAENLSTILASKGVDNDKLIIVYANNSNGWGEDGRIVWMLRMAGIQNSKMLDGGFDFWNNSGYQVSTEETTPTASDFTVTTLDQTWTISTQELNASLDNLKILDSRSLEEYDGAANYGEARGGHIPGAILLTFANVLKEDGTFKNQAGLETIFANAGLAKDDEIVTYCTAGIRSAHLALVLRMAGYPNSMNYDASFYEWAGNDNLTVES